LTGAASSTGRADPETARIARELLSEPHVRGRRVSVRQLRALVEEAGEDPATVAERFDLEVADVYHALAYYHDRPGEMEAVAAEREAAIGAVRESLDRPEDVDSGTDAT
jgi:uncharacterized protein (DUF433 family)